MLGCRRGGASGCSIRCLSSGFRASRLSSSSLTVKAGTPSLIACSIRRRFNSRVYSSQKVLEEILSHQLVADSVEHALFDFRPVLHVPLSVPHEATDIQLL